MLPTSLRILTSGAEFNHPMTVNALPAELTDIFGEEFNQALEVGILTCEPDTPHIWQCLRPLPAGLAHLTLGESFYHPVMVKMLPDTP